MHYNPYVVIFDLPHHLSMDQSVTSAMHHRPTLAQLKIIEEVITLSVFVPFSMLYMKEGFRLDFIWAGLCRCGAVLFIFRK